MELLLKYFPNLTSGQQERFAQLAELYAHWNAQINVISRKDMEHFYERHVLHSLAVAKHFSFKPGTKILDIGTGGGFPAIPLAIMFPEVQLTACDSIAKKIKVVNEVAHALELKNLNTHAGRVEQLNKKFDFIVSRAVAPLNELYGWSKHLLALKWNNEKPNGWICLKGGDLAEEIKTLAQVAPHLKTETYLLKEIFAEEFFETKKLLYVH